MEDSMYIIEPEYNEEGIHIADHYLGNGYYHSIMDMDCDSFVAKYNNNVVGWSAISYNESVPVLQSLVVDEKYRGMGVSDLLMEHRLDHLKDQGFRYVKAYAWTKPNGHCNAAKMLQRNKFYHLHTIDGYYSHLTNCPCCGNGNQCQCYARVYCRSI
jgi:GNAT superfamily N-acetyltransferase